MVERLIFGPEWIAVSNVDVGSEYCIQVTRGFDVEATVSEGTPTGNVGERLALKRFYGVRAGTGQVWLRSTSSSLWSEVHIINIESPEPPGHKGDYSPADYSADDYYLFQDLTGPA